MARNWEDVVRSWTGPSSPSEQDKMNNAERMIGDAIRASSALSEHNIRVFPQGSYRNNTNVKQESDVDICVCCMDVIYTDFDFSEGYGRAEAGIVDASYTFSQYKQDVEAALVAKFGRSAVTRGNKAFDICENSYRVAADAVPCFEHRRYEPSTGTEQHPYISGTEFKPDTGSRIINWPNQQYNNGVEKNNATGGRYKKLVRIVKRLNIEMTELGYQSAQPIPSFLVECLVYNVPNEAFGHNNYLDDVRDVLAHIFNQTLASGGYEQWVEVSELKWLFRPSQPWTVDQAHAFISDGWDYIGFD